MNTSTAKANIDIEERAFLAGIYGLLAKGFLVSAVSGYIIMSSNLLDMMFTDDGLSGFGYLALFAPLGLLLLQMFHVIPATPTASKAVFWSFVALKGFFLAYLTAIFPPEALVQAMAVTAAAFAGLSLYANTTSRNLSECSHF